MTDFGDWLRSYKFQTVVHSTSFSALLKGSTVSLITKKAESALSYLWNRSVRCVPKRHKLRK